jgi:hypothetical protein
MPPLPPPGQVDMSRPECRHLQNEKKELERQRRIWAQRLQSATSPEEKEGILATIDGLDTSIQDREERLMEEGCYIGPGGTPVLTRVLEVVHIELTQSIQFYSADGSGAARDNSVTLIQEKPLLVRFYMKTVLSEAQWVTGYLDVFGYNPNTTKYDIHRRSVNALAYSRARPSPTNSRRTMSDTLNFLVPADICWGRTEVRATVWVSGHESDPPGTNPSYVVRGSQLAQFLRPRLPIIRCFRIDLTQRIPGQPQPSTFAAPLFTDCESTMTMAQRMFPVPRLDIRDMGTRAFSGQLQTFRDYDAVRGAIQTVHDGTTPTPANNELFVAMLPAHSYQWGGGQVLGQQLAQSLQTTVGFQALFAHELGHWLLPGDDHVMDNACVNAALPLTEIDASYPDYANAAQRAGIGEWGVNTGTNQLFSPDAAAIMSYCGNRWISPYNYERAISGPVLSGASTLEAGAATNEDRQKLLIAFRLHSDGHADLRWALHLPGEPPLPSISSMTDISIELYDDGGAMLATCHRPADRPPTGPHEDFQEVLPWYESAASVVVSRGSEELARWSIEERGDEMAVSGLTVAEDSSPDGSGDVTVEWKAPKRRTDLHYMLRMSPDDGQSWIPVANAIQGNSVDIPAANLRGLKNVRFQLAVSTGFRTSLVESKSSIEGPTFMREVRIVEPTADSVLAPDQPVTLIGALTQRAGGQDEPPHAYWTSHRDGYLADGFSAVIPPLSIGRHVLRFVVDDGSGGELVSTCNVRVQDPDADQ